MSDGLRETLYESWMVKEEYMTIRGRLRDSLIEGKDNLNVRGPLVGWFLSLIDWPFQVAEAVAH